MGRYPKDQDTELKLLLLRNETNRILSKYSEVMVMSNDLLSLVFLPYVFPNSK